MVPLRYRRILLTTEQWDSNGDAMNWHALFILKAIPGFVSVTSEWPQPWSGIHEDLREWETLAKFASV